MKSVLSFYFDGTIVQAVKVRVADGLITVEDARTFLFSDFDDYLSTCKEKRCVVSSNPQLFYQDIVHLPPAAGKFYGKLVRSEIQKNHLDLPICSIFHRTVGESTIDTKTYSKIAAFSYPDDFLADFISKLNHFGIRASRIYAAPYSIFRLALSACGNEPEQPRIFVASIPGEKLLLVEESNELAFIRKLPSLDSTLLPEDAYNINMTVDYCFQSLRVRPFEAVMINKPEWSEDIDHLVSVPFRSALPAQLNGMPSHLAEDYLAPIATALQHFEAPRVGNIVPSEYISFTLQRRLLTTATLILFTLAAALATYLVPQLITISGLNTKINMARTETSGSAAELADFKKLDAEVANLKQPLELANRHNASLNPAAALAALVLPDSQDYTVRAVSVQRGEENLNVQIDGTINATGFSDTQAAFEKLSEQLSKISGYAIAAGKVDIKLKTFSIQAHYSGGGEQAK